MNNPVRKVWIDKFCTNATEFKGWNIQWRYSQCSSFRSKFFRTAVNRTDFYQDVGNAKFVLSPPGNGLDCFRTWEALALGAIPVVQNSSLWQLYEGERILVVSDITKVSPLSCLPLLVGDPGIHARLHNKECASAITKS